MTGTWRHSSRPTSAAVRDPSSAREDLVRAPLAHARALLDQRGGAGERVAVAGQDELAAVRGRGRLERREVGQQRARAVGRRREGDGVGHADGHVRDRVGGDLLQQVVAGEQQPVRGEHGVRRRVAGPLGDRPAAPARLQLAAGLEDAADRDRRPGEAAVGAADLAERRDRPRAHAVAAHQRDRVVVVGLHARVEVAQVARRASPCPRPRRPSGAPARRRGRRGRRAGG